MFVRALNQTHVERNSLDVYFSLLIFAIAWKHAPCSGACIDAVSVRKKNMTKWFVFCLKNKFVVSQWKCQHRRKLCLPLSNDTDKVRWSVKSESKSCIKNKYRKLFAIIGLSTWTKRITIAPTICWRFLSFRTALRIANYRIWP